MSAELQSVLDELTYKPGWRFHIDSELGLIVTAETIESGGRFSKPRNNVDGNILFVKHEFPLPPSDFSDSSEAMRWVLDCIVKVETHEAMEFFTIGNPQEGGGKPFFPQHGPLDEYDAYVIPRAWSTTL